LKLALEIEGCASGIKVMVTVNRKMVST